MRNLIFSDFHYEDEFLDIVDMANSMLQAYGLIQKCLVIPEGDIINRFDRLCSDEFLQFANHGIGNCYLWKSITGDGFHKLVLGYGQTAEFLFMECTGISKDEKVFPILFLLRNLIELGLKRMFYKTIEHGVPKNIFMSKRRSHLLYKELWKNARPMIEYYADAQGQNVQIIDIVEK